MISSYFGASGKLFLFIYLFLFIFFFYFFFFIYLFIFYYFFFFFFFFVNMANPGYIDIQFLGRGSVLFLKYFLNGDR